MGPIKPIATTKPFLFERKNIYLYIHVTTNPLLEVSNSLSCSFTPKSAKHLRNQEVAIANNRDPIIKSESYSHHASAQL